jgi:sugar (pentulose or hexulose) kinase
MTPETVLGVDIGTSATKAVLVDLDGRVLARARREHGLDLPAPGWVEHDAEAVWWQEFVSVCQELAPRAQGGLRAVGVSGIGPCVVPCDANLHPLRPAILYGVDTRAAREIDELEELLGAGQILARGGSNLSAQALGPKLLWLRRNEPELWERAAGWYMASSFIAARLTGAYVLDHHSASQCDPFYDLQRGEWAEDWVRQVLGPLPMPELLWPSEQAGIVTPAAAQATGVPAGTPVVTGTIDAWAEGLSAGVRHPGDLMVMYGSTMFFVQVADGAAPQQLLWTTQGVERGTQTLSGRDGHLGLTDRVAAAARGRSRLGGPGGPGGRLTGRRSGAPDAPLLRRRAHAYPRPASARRDRRADPAPRCWRPVAFRLRGDCLWHTADPRAAAPGRCTAQARGRRGWWHQLRPLAADRQRRHRGDAADP